MFLLLSICILPFYPEVHPEGMWAYNVASKGDICSLYINYIVKVGISDLQVEFMYFHKSAFDLSFDWSRSVTVGIAPKKNVTKYLCNDNVNWFNMLY